MITLPRSRSRTAHASQWVRLSGTTPAVDRYLLQRQFRRISMTGDGSINPSRCAGSVPHVHRRRGTIIADSVEANRLMVGVVVEPDARAEQDWCDVQVDLVDQAELEELTSDAGRETSTFLPPIGTGW
jgi:hypothetical protein